jgi:hypothetical protein
MFGADWCKYGAVCAVFIKYSAVLSSILLFGADWSDYGAVFIKYSVVSSSKVLIGASMVLFVLSLSNIVLFYQVYCCLVLIGASMVLFVLSIKYSVVLSSILLFGTIMADAIAIFSDEHKP